MERSYIFFDREQRLFREYAYNPDSESEGQWVERVFSTIIVLYAHSHSSTEEEFLDMLDSMATTTLHDKGTNGYDDIENFIKSTNTIPDWTFRNPTLLVSAAGACYHNCKDCIHFASCEKTLEKDCVNPARNPVKDCKFFILDDYCKIFLPEE